MSARKKGKGKNRKTKTQRQRPADGNRQTPRFPRLDLETPEIAAARATLTRAFIPSRHRIDIRAADARKFNRWRVNPSKPQPGSSIVLDGTDFFPESVTENVSENPVFDHAVFPAMAAAENLTTVVRLIDDIDRIGQLRTLSLATLCRSALESSSRAVWVLSPTSRDERRDRALRMTKSEVLAQKKFLDKQKAALQSSNDSRLREGIEQVTADLEHAINVLNDLDAVAGVPTIEQTIEKASEWVDETAVNPQHTPLAGSSRSLYAIASGLAHGYTWTTKHMQGPADLFNYLADSLYSGVTMLSAAVILYEAQASVTDDISDLCPEHIRPVAVSFHARYST